MKKILMSMLFIAISSTSLLADRATAVSNAIVAGMILENQGYIVKNIGGKYLRRKGYRTLNRYLYSGNCYAVVSVGDNNVRDLDLKVYDRYWDYLGTDNDSDKTALIKICPRHSGTFRFRTIMYNGSGYYRMVLAWK